MILFSNAFCWSLKDFKHFFLHILFLNIYCYLELAIKLNGYAEAFIEPVPLTWKPLPKWYFFPPIVSQGEFFKINK